MNSCVSCSRDKSYGLHRRFKYYCDVLACLSQSLPAQTLSALAWLDNCITFQRDDAYTVESKYGSHCGVLECCVQQGAKHGRARGVHWCLSKFAPDASGEKHCAPCYAFGGLQARINKLRSAQILRSLATKSAYTNAATEVVSSPQQTSSSRGCSVLPGHSL